MAGILELYYIRVHNNKRLLHKPVSDRGAACPGRVILHPRGMIHNKIHLISPGPSIALTVQNRGLKHHSLRQSRQALTWVVIVIVQSCCSLGLHGCFRVRIVATVFIGPRGSPSCSGGGGCWCGGRGSCVTCCVLSSVAGRVVAVRLLVLLLLLCKVT